MPKLRFPEFIQEWKTSKIGEQFQLVSGQHLNPDQYSNIKESDASTPYFTGPSDFTTDQDLLTKWSIKQTRSSLNGDLLFTVKGSGVGSMMIQSFPEVSIGRQLMALRTSKGNTFFLFQRLHALRNYYVALASGNMIPGLTRGDIISTKLNFPTLPEQQKIATFLTAVDRRIALLKQKKEKLEAYKKGVMQQLFSRQIRFKQDD